MRIEPRTLSDVSRPRRRGRRPRAGAAALVEFACVLPLIAVLAFGIIEFGMAWQDKLRVQTAVRAGARVGSTAGKLSTADKRSCSASAPP